MVEHGFLILQLTGVIWKFTMSASKKVFVTVGTTSFDKLIETVSDTSVIEVCLCFIIDITHSSSLVMNMHNNFHGLY